MDGLKREMEETFMHACMEKYGKCEIDLFINLSERSGGFCAEKRR